MLENRERDAMHLRMTQNTDIVPYVVAQEQCKSGHSWGPGIRDYYLVHYIKSGKGVFKAGGREFELHTGQMFFIFPEDISYYIADVSEPWHYCWLSFGGSSAASYLNQAGITLQNPIFTINDNKQIPNCLMQMLDNYDNVPAHRLRFFGLMYSFMSYLIENSQSSTIKASSIEQYFGRAAEYISQNYSHQLSVEGIASFVGIDRKYLYQIFKKTCGVSPESYIIQFRMDRACELMGNAALTISNIAHSIGYNDPLLFSRMFRKSLGVSPTEYRKAKTADIKVSRIENECERMF